MVGTFADVVVADAIIKGKFPMPIIYHMSSLLFSHFIDTL